MKKRSSARRGCQRNRTRSRGGVSGQRWLVSRTWQLTEVWEDGYVRAAEAGVERLLRQTLGIGRRYSHRADRVSLLDCWR